MSATGEASVTVTPLQQWHELKVQKPYFDAVFEGQKTFEVRKNDRGFQRGDVLRLREYDPSGDHDDCTDRTCRTRRYTGRECLRVVSFVYSGDPRFGGVEPGFVVLALRNPNGDAEWSA